MPTRKITAKQLKRRMDARDDLLLVDLMPPSQYVLLHLPGAINIPLDYLHEVLPYLPHDKDIVFYCNNKACEFSRVAARKLELHGFTNAVVLTGGMAAWEKAGQQFATILLRPAEEAPAPPPQAVGAPAQ